MRFIRWFAEVGLADVGLVGGKVASLGEMIRELQPLGIRVPDGFAVTAEGYRHFIAAAGLDEQIRERSTASPSDDVQALRRAQRGDPQADHLRPRCRARSPTRRWRRIARSRAQYGDDGHRRRGALVGDGGGSAGRELRGAAGHVPERARRGGAARRRSKRCFASPLHRARHQLSRRHGLRPSDVALSSACRRWSARD